MTKQNKKMRIGVFDSGLGGLFVMRALAKQLPQYDYVYLGDTARLPYGPRRQNQIYKFLCQGANFLFARNCKLIIVACNTASARALHRLQKNYLPKRYPGKKVLGVIVPTAEIAVKAKNKIIGVLATAGTVKSGAFAREIKKLQPQAKVYEQAAPMLVPLIEKGHLKQSLPYLRRYLKPLQQRGVEALILGCTHYPILKKQITMIAGNKIKIISQEEIIPRALRKYLQGHSEIKRALSSRHQREFFVTKKTRQFQNTARRWFSSALDLQKIVL